MIVAGSVQQGCIGRCLGWRITLAGTVAVLLEHHNMDNDEKEDGRSQGQLLDDLNLMCRVSVQNQVLGMTKFFGNGILWIVSNIIGRARRTRRR